MAAEEPPASEEVGRASASWETVRLERWHGPVDDDDPNANFKTDVALHAPLDPMRTIRGLADAVGLSPGAVARYALAKYATAGSGGLLEIGPSMVHRLWEPIERAERLEDDAARLAAYGQLRSMLSWLRAPLSATGLAVDHEARDDGGN